MNRRIIASIVALVLVASVIYFINTDNDNTNVNLDANTQYKPDVAKLNSKIEILKQEREKQKKHEETTLSADVLARRAEIERNQREGYGTTEPIHVKDADGNYLSNLSPQIKSLAKAIDSGNKPNQVSILISAKPFNKDKWNKSKEYKKSYMTDLEPGRVFQSSSDKKAIKLEALSKFYVEIEQETGEATIEVKGKAGYPISAFSPDLGEFSNQLTTQTIIADSDGKAVFKFKGPSGTIADCNIIMSSPVCMGQLKFVVHVRKTIKK